MNLKPKLKDNKCHLYELPNKSKFKFPEDNTEYWFKKIDGFYGQVFSTEKDMKTFTNPAFISASTIVVPLQ